MAFPKPEYRKPHPYAFQVPLLLYSDSEMLITGMALFLRAKATVYRTGVIETASPSLHVSLPGATAKQQRR